MINQLTRNFSFFFVFFFSLRGSGRLYSRSKVWMSGGLGRGCGTEKSGESHDYTPGDDGFNARKSEKTPERPRKAAADISLRQSN